MIIFNTKSVQLFVLTITTCLYLNNLVSTETEESKKPLKEYLRECPWIGLIANKITFGPITVSNVNIHEGSKLAFASPGETLNGWLKYKVDAKDLDSLHLYHLVVGIKNEGAQDCITHSLGICNSKGSGHFTLKAPDKAGIYEVRFLLTEALTCANARDVWNSGHETPSAAATIGIIIVE